MNPKTKQIAIITGGIVTVLLGIGLLIVALLSGATIDVSAILGGVGTLLGSAAILLGLRRPTRVAPPPVHHQDAVTPIETPRPRSSSGLLGFAFVALALSVTACPGAACQTEQTIVSALSAGVNVASEAIGDAPDEDVALALRLSQGAVLLGQAAVFGCGLVRDGEGWQAWVGLALEAAVGVVSFFGGAGPEDLPADPPIELTAAIELLEAEID